MSLVEAILRFDGTHVDELKHALSNEHSRDDWREMSSFFDSDDRMHQTASTWLVKNAAEKGYAIDPEVLEKLILVAPQFTHWEPRLHLLQTVKYLPNDLLTTDRISKLVAEYCADKKTLLRVWALDARCRIAMAKGDGSTLQTLLQHAQDDKAASMRARARLLREEFAKVL